MALFANVHRGKNQKAFEPQDFYRLSFDKAVVEERPLTFKEAKAQFGSRIKRDGK